MGDGYGFRPRIRLMDAQLRLDPDIQQRMAEIEADMAARRTINDWLRPNFSLLLPQWRSILSQEPDPLNMTLPSPPTPGFPPQPPTRFDREPGPAQTADAGKLAEAIYKLPAVQRLVDQAHDEGLRQLRVLRSDWDNASTTGKVGMISFSTLVVGGMVAGVMSNPGSRNAALGLINGKQIPIPGVNGLSMTFTLQPGGTGAAANYGVVIGLDVMELIRK